MGFSLLLLFLLFLYSPPCNCVIFLVEMRSLQKPPLPSIFSQSCPLLFNKHIKPRNRLNTAPLAFFPRFNLTQKNICHLTLPQICEILLAQNKAVKKYKVHLSKKREVEDSTYVLVLLNFEDAPDTSTGMRIILLFL